jgi:hypothetical protein
MSDPIKPGVYPDLDEAAYHGDRHSLSASGMKLLLDAPAKFAHRLEHAEHKDVFDLGTAAHRKVLGVGAEIVTVDADDWRSKAAREARDEARADGKVALLTKDAAVVDAMALALASHRLASHLFTNGQAELSMFWHDDSWDVTRRARFDWLRDDGIAVDFKTTANANPSRLPAACHDFGYHIQEANYRDVAGGLDVDISDFVFVFQEKTAPYLVTVAHLDPAFVSLGRTRCAQALERFRDCTASGLWPGYADDLTDLTITAPRWAS